MNFNPRLQYESNLNAVSLAQYPFINSAVIENINQSITSDECYDQVHVNQLMCALWNKDDLAERALYSDNRNNGEGNSTRRRPNFSANVNVPRPLTPEKFWFVRGKCSHTAHALIDIHK